VRGRCRGEGDAFAYILMVTACVHLVPPVPDRETPASHGKIDFLLLPVFVTVLPAFSLTARADYGCHE